VAFIFAVIQGASTSWAAPEVIAAFVVAAVMLPVFCVNELRHRAPMFQIRLLAIPAFRGAAVAGLLGMLSFLGTVYAIAIKLGAVEHLAPLAIAERLVVIQAVPLLVGPWLPRLLRAIAARTLLISGFAIMAAGELWFALLPDGETGYLPLLPAFLLIGVGFIIMMSSLTVAAINSVPGHALGMASGAISLVRETGQALGASVVGAIALSHANGILPAKIAALQLPAALAGIVHAVNSIGGPLALANAPLPGGLSAKVAPAASWALQRGYDLGLIVMAACALAAALAVALLMAAKVTVPEPDPQAEAEPVG
jgi:hypothetical protein